MKVRHLFTRFARRAGAAVIVMALAQAVAAAEADNKRFNEALRAYQVGDYATAFERFERLADEGDPDAQYYVGFMHAQGLGAPQDYARAANWYERAALQGYAPAQNYLGLLYYEGKGVDRDFRTAFIYFELAAAQGNQDGINNRLIVAKKMTTQQITEAQQAAGELIRKINQDEGIKLPNSLGGGVIVSGAGHVLTHQSVVERCKTIKIRLDGEVAPAEVALEDAFNAFVLLQTETPLGEPAQFAQELPEVGASVRILSYHVDEDLAVSPRAHEAEIRNSPTIIRDDQRYFELAAPDAQESDNGAPLFDAAGELVGIAVTEIEPERIARITGPLPPDLLFAQRADLAKVVMHINGIAVGAQASAIQPASTAADNAESAREAAVAVECWQGDGRVINPGAVSRMRGVAR